MTRPDAIRTLVADTIAAHVDRITKDAAGNPRASCSCGDLSTLMPPPVSREDLDAFWAVFRLHRADAVLAVLTDAGAVLPSAVHEEFGYRERWHGTDWGSVTPCVDRVVAEAMAQPRDNGIRERQAMQRRAHYGPWQEIRRAADALPCCDMHNHHCEPPSELCCGHCTEVHHPDHRPGEACVLSVESNHG